MTASDDKAHRECCFDLSEPSWVSSSLMPPDSGNLRAYGEGKAKWLEMFWFPTQRRKQPTLSFSVVNCTIICIKSDSCPVETKCSAFDDSWRKSVSSALKKIEVEDLGDMDAMELQESIPEEDSNGRGMKDLLALQKQLSVRVVFCNKHVLLVGQKSKLQKKCFVLRNMLSHYHWRLSGKDVSFGSMTGKS